MRILKKGLKITFINPNTEEQVVQAIAGVLAYNLAESDNKIIFDYNSNAYQNSHLLSFQYYYQNFRNITFILKLQVVN